LVLDGIADVAGPKLEMEEAKLENLRLVQV
jgi:hypothetical protein